MTAAIAIIAFIAWLIVLRLACLLCGFNDREQRQGQREPEWLARAIEIGGASDGRFFNHDGSVIE